MATDAVVVAIEDPAAIEAPGDFTTLVQFAPLPPGRSYLVWACGGLIISRALVTVKLEAFDATHSIDLGQGPNPFSLAVGTTLPADDDLFTVAKVSARARALPGPVEVSFQQIRLVVLAVDTLAVQVVF
jgi:hypothetical protein